MCSAFRHEPGVGAKYIGIDKLASTFTKLGHRLSAQNKEFITANFAVQDEKERGIALEVVFFESCATGIVNLNKQLLYRNLRS